MSEKNSNVYKDNFPNLVNTDGSVNAAEFARLYSTVLATLLWIPQAYGLDMETAKDIVQGRFMRYYEILLTRGDPHPQRNQGNYLRVAVHHATRDYLAKASLKLTPVGNRADRYSKRPSVPSRLEDHLLNSPDLTFINELRTHISALPIDSEIKDQYLQLLEMCTELGKLTDKDIMRSLHLDQPAARILQLRFKAAVKAFIEAKVQDKSPLPQTVYKYTAKIAEKPRNTEDQATPETMKIIRLCIHSGYIPINYIYSEGKHLPLNSPIHIRTRHHKLQRNGIRTYTLEEIRQLIPELSQIPNPPLYWIREEDLLRAAKRMLVYKSDTEDTLRIVEELKST